MFNHALSDADAQIQDIMKLEQITISENSLSSCHKTMTVDAEVQYDLADLSFEEGVVANISPTTEKVDEDEKSSISSCAENVFPCPPILRRNEYGSLILIDDDNDKGEYVYDSDDTCDEYVECGENGLCKCKKMREGEFYEYYMQNKDGSPHKMYPERLQGKRVLPKGAVFHFTGASKSMKREDVKEALVALGAKVEFVDYQMGNEEGWARLSYPHEAKIIIKRMIDKKLNIAGADLIFSVLTKKDEKRYHKKIINAIQQLQKKTKGLARKLKKSGYKYVTQYTDNGSSEDK